MKGDLNHYRVHLACEHDGTTFARSNPMGRRVHCASCYMDPVTKRHRRIVTSAKRTPSPFRKEDQAA